MRGPLVALVVLCGSAPLRAQPGAVATAVPDRNRILLSEPVRVALTIEGPAPMRNAVELPDPLLTADADGSWRIRPDGAVEIAALPNGRERWRRVYRLDPYAPGKPLRATFAPITVHGRPLKGPLTVEVTVERTGGDAPLPEALPVTSVEDLPPALRSPREPFPALAITGAVVAGAVLLAAAWRRRRRTKPVPPGAWARGALAELERAGAGGAEVAGRVADILRRFVERRFGIPAPRLTTSELDGVVGAQGWPADDVRALRALLDACDLAKFAGTAPDAEAAGRLIRAAEGWLDRRDPPAGG